MTNTTPNRASVLRAVAAIVALLAQVTGAAAFDLALPGNAHETTRRDASPDSYRLAIAPFAEGELPGVSVQGAVSRAAWQVDAQGITTLQLLTPLKSQLTDAGFDILFECADRACGGFDFRYRIDIFAAPDMHVDLFDFRYLAAHRITSDGASEHLEVLVSRNSTAGFIQITTITPPGHETPIAKPTGAALQSETNIATSPLATMPLDRQLETQGHAILADLTFETGSSALGAGNFGSLDDLAAFLTSDPSRRVALVGHTDAVGSLDANITLSKRRAASVLERLVTSYGVARDQMTAEGMGYLAPVTTNLTAEGRDQNRRVEAVLLNIGE